MNNLLRKAVAVSAFPSMLVLSLAVGQAPRCYAQTAVPPDGWTKVAALHEAPAATDVSPARPAAAPDPASSVDIAKELAAMKARIELLEAELKSRTQPAVVAGPAVAAASVGAPGPAVVSASASGGLSQE